MICTQKVDTVKKPPSTFCSRDVRQEDLQRKKFTVTGLFKIFRN